MKKDKRKRPKATPKQKNQFYMLVPVILISIGFVLIFFDAIPSIILQIEDTLLFHLGRVLRAGFGVVLIGIGFIMIRYSKPKRSKKGK